MRIALVFSSLVFLLGGCADLQPRPAMAPDWAIPPADDAPLDQATAELERTHPGQSAFRLVVEGTEAFMSRVQSARLAKRSIDVQMYIWHVDLTGMYFAQELLAAADRGVKVRLLLDDMDARAHNDAIAALASHPNIQVRSFNPFASRSGAVALISEGLSSFERVNRRMHNKSWIADNRLAITGGRNIGDEYFGASDEVNFIDLDFAMIGPVVRDASASFDKYWNSHSAYPMELLDAQAVNEAALARLRTLMAEQTRRAQSSRYAKALSSDEAIKRMMSGEWPMQWSANYQFVSDDPRKVAMKEQDASRTNVGSTLVPMIKGAQTSLKITSPYFVPGDEVTSQLVQAVKTGKDVRVLTNSLVANDVAAVHGGYSRYRRPLLAGGVQLWELKPLNATKVDSSLFGSSGASLHTKSFAVDGKTIFVGSYNLDPRSTWLNCEQGVMVENATLALELEQIFASQTSGGHAWHVTLEHDDMRWTDGEEVFDSDPKATVSRRFSAWITRLLRLDAQL